MFIILDPIDKWSKAWHVLDSHCCANWGITFKRCSLQFLCAHFTSLHLTSTYITSEILLLTKSIQSWQAQLALPDSKSSISHADRTQMYIYETPAIVNKYTYMRPLQWNKQITVKSIITMLGATTKTTLATCRIGSKCKKEKKNIIAQHSIAQHSIAQHSTAQHSTAQHSTAQHSTAQHSTAQHSKALSRARYLKTFSNLAKFPLTQPCLSYPE